MRRTFNILALSGLALAAVLALAWFVLFMTPPGRGFIAAQIEAALGDVLGGKAEIGALEGRLPGEIVLRDVAVRDDGGVWLTAETLALEWRPLALLNGKISIDSLALEGADLLRRPAPGPEEAPSATRKAIGLPDGLPGLAIRNLTLAEIRLAEEIAGRALVIDGAGAVRAEGGLLALRLEAYSDADYVDVAINLDPHADYGSLDIVVASEANGAIAALLDLGGPAFVEIEGAAPLSRFEAELNGDIGAYGAVEAKITSDLLAAEEVSVDASATFGDKLAEVAALTGPQVFLQAKLAQRGDEIAVDIVQLETEAGAASGTLRWRNRGGAIDSAQGEIAVSFAPGHFEDIQKYVGASASVIADAKPAPRGYALDAQLSAPLMTVSLSEAQTDLESRLAGRLAGDLSANDALPPPFRQGARINGAITLAKGEGVAFSALDITLPDGSTITGAGAYGGEARAVEFAGDVSLTPDFVAERVSSLVLDGPLMARVTASGKIDDFSVIVDAESTEAEMNDAAVPAAEITARLDNLPKNFTAAVSAQAIGREGELNLLFKQGDSGSFSLPSVLVESPLFRLAGSGAWNGASETASIDLTYVGQENAQPYPGVRLAGSLAAKGKIGRGVAVSRLRITGENLVSDDFAVGALDLDASGSFERIAFDFDAEALTAPGAGLFDTIDGGGALDLSGTPQLRLERLDAERAGVPLALAAPATIVFGDETEVKNLRLRYGDDGALALDGRFSSHIWQATLKAERLPLPEANALASFAIALDTEAAEPARGDFTLASLFAAGEQLEISGDLIWDGERVRLAQSKPDDPLQFEFDAPLILTRTPKLAVAAEGSISGRLVYEGALEAIAPYFPASFQTLEGRVDANARLSGTFAAPAIDGEITLRDGAYTELVSGLTLTNVHVEAAAQSAAGQSQMKFVAGARGAGQDAETITLNGTVAIAETSSIDAELKFDKAAFAAGPVKRAVTSGAIRFTGPLASINAAGALRVDELDAEIIDPPAGGLVDIEVVAADGAGAPEPAAIASRPPPFVLDVAFAADDRIFIRGRGLDSEWRADISATGEASNPLLVGNLTLRRGTLDFSGRRFTFTRGVIAFDRLSENDPALDLRAEYKTGDGVTAAIEVSGRASAPIVSLVSSPSRPPEDIMALILFGKPARDLTALESLQVAQALAQLSGVGPFGSGGGVTGIARRTLGLDLLNISIDSEAGASSLEAGKYVAEGLFVSVKQDARGENGSVRVEYEITDSISVETEIRQDGEQTVSTNWKRDF